MPGDLSPLFFARFVYGQLFGRLPIPKASFAGKTVIVTGSNAGLGMLPNTAALADGAMHPTDAGVQGSRRLATLSSLELQSSSWRCDL